MDREAWRAALHGVAKSRTRLSDWTKPNWTAFFTVQLSHPYMTTGKTIALTIWTFVGKVKSLLLNMLSRFVRGSINHWTSLKLQGSLTQILICKMGIINDLAHRFAMRCWWKVAFNMLCLTSSFFLGVSAVVAVAVEAAAPHSSSAVLGSGVPGPVWASWQELTVNFSGIWQASY